MVEDIEPTKIESVIQTPFLTNSSSKPLQMGAPKLDCSHGELLTFWRPPTKQDLEYETPFKFVGPSVKYVTFEPVSINFYHLKQIIHNYV